MPEPTVNIALTEADLKALLPEHDGDNSALSRIHREMRNKLHNFEAVAEDGIDASDAGVLRNVREADAVMLIRMTGPLSMTGAAWIKKLGGVPMDTDIQFGIHDEDPPGTIRRVVCKAGFTLSEWRKMDRSGLHEEAARD